MLDVVYNYQIQLLVFVIRILNEPEFFVAVVNLLLVLEVFWGLG